MARPWVLPEGLRSSSIQKEFRQCSGVVSYDVSLRRQELAIRMALGATPGGIRRKVLGEGAILVAFSVALGFAGAALLGHFLAGVLYRVSPVDPWTYGAVAATLALVALVACWAPAERATRVDLAQSLRGDSL